MESPQDTMSDIENEAALPGLHSSSTVTKLSWKNVGVSSINRVKDVKSTPIISNVDGVAKAGMAPQVITKAWQWLISRK